jgi:CBS domain-containing protein
LRVVDAMNRNLISVDGKVSVSEASALISKEGSGCAIILRNGRPIGMMTERDVTYKVAAKELNPKNITAEDIMSSPLVEIDPDADLIEAANLMDKNKIRRLAVVSQGILYGIISALDIARNLEGYFDNELRKIMRHAFFIS